MKTTESEKLYKEALNYFPGGVNSPVRAFRSVGGTPLFIDRGEGCRLFDVDGNSYIDFCCSWGPLLLGHAHPDVVQAIQNALLKGTSFGAPSRLENELARLILSNNSYIEVLRFVSSGTEAVMSAIRLARGATARDKIIKFNGCYHGHSDAMLVKAGSGLATFGVSSSAGVPAASSGDTVVIELGDLTTLKTAFSNHPDSIACVIMEPVPANNGLLLQTESYLRAVKELCEENGALLVFDEVITGFRLGFEGASGWYGIKPDITTYGKIIGGGLPVGAYGSTGKTMKQISPDGPVYQAGTLSGNPIAMAAGIAQLSFCLENSFYEMLATRSNNFYSMIRSHLAAKNYKAQLITIGSIFWLAFDDAKEISKAPDIKAESMAQFNKFYHHLLDEGVYFGPSGYEVGFVSSAHTENDLKQAAASICKALDLTLG